MAYRILVVKAEQEFVSTFTALTTGFDKDLDISFVAGRKEAMSELKTSVFDRIVTALKIPRISDGYLLLSYIAKTLTNQKIIVVVDEKSDEVERSIKILGVKHLFSSTNVQGVFQAILTDAGLKPTKSNSNDAQQFEFGPVTVEKIKTSLNWVMGPVGTMIYNDAAAEIGNETDLNMLLNLIAREIGEERKIALFRDHLKA